MYACLWLAGHGVVPSGALERGTTIRIDSSFCGLLVSIQADGAVWSSLDNLVSEYVSVVAGNGFRLDRLSSRDSLRKLMMTRQEAIERKDIDQLRMR